MRKNNSFVAKMEESVLKSQKNLLLLATMVHREKMDIKVLFRCETLVIFYYICTNVAVPKGILNIE